MDHSKKVLILHATAGHGHQKAAQALEEACRKLLPSAEVRIEDTLRFTPGFFGSGYKNTYLFLIQHVPVLWGFCYYFFDQRWLYRIVRPLRRFVNRRMAAALERMVVEEQPSVILSTHFLATEVCGVLRKEKRITCPVVTVITDYLPHYFWIEDGVDLYVVAADETKAELLRRGVSADKIRVLGIPVEAKFARALDRSTICKRLGIDDAVFTLLLTSGGAGVGHAEKMIEMFFALQKPLQILAVCGTNRALFETLGRRFGNRVGFKAFGFVDNMDELMEAADLVVGKAGGLTVSESLAKVRPIIMFEPVPGQETRNAVCVEHRGAGFIAANYKEVIQRVSELMDQPSELLRLKQNVRSASKPSAAADIIEMVKKQYGL